MTTIYTAEDVAKHNAKTDLWVTIHGKVYDITPYLEDHPGGVPSLIEVAGQDATEVFEDFGHSDHAKKVLGNYLIGKMDHEEEDMPPTIVRHLAPEPVVEAKPLLNTTTIIAIAEVFSIVTIITLGFIIARRLGRLAVAHESWSSPSFASGLFPWLTSTSMASVLITKYVQTKFPTSTPTKRPPHFKVDATKMVSVPKPDETILKAGQQVDLPISAIERLSADSNKIVLDLPKPGSTLGLPIGQHITICSHINGKEVSRQYTPTSSNKDLGRLELVIKNYDDGLMTGQYLKDVQVGDKLSISGPKGQMHYRRGLAQTINMVAGGTGITPMYQVIRAICKDPSDDTKVVLIYANKSESDILLKKELDGLVAKHNAQLQVHYILSRPNTEWSGRVGRCTQELCQCLFTQGDDKRIKAMLCGPPAMIDNAKEWLVNMGYERAKGVSKMRDQVFVF